MQIGFVHFDREDQKKYLAAISRITEGGAIDELGVGRLRDFFSDRLFPGVSSLHQIPAIMFLNRFSQFDWLNTGRFSDGQFSWNKP